MVCSWKIVRTQAEIVVILHSFGLTLGIAICHYYVAKVIRESRDDFREVSERDNESITSSNAHRTLSGGLSSKGEGLLPHKALDSLPNSTENFPSSDTFVRAFQEDLDFIIRNYNISSSVRLRFPTRMRDLIPHDLGFPFILICFILALGCSSNLILGNHMSALMTLPCNSLFLLV